MSPDARRRRKVGGDNSGGVSGGASGGRDGEAEVGQVPDGGLTREFTDECRRQGIKLGGDRRHELDD